MQALRAARDPRTADDAVAEFADCPPVTFAKPKLWPGPDAAATTARLLWDATSLYISYAVEGAFADAVDPARCTADALDALQAMYDRSYADDERLQRVSNQHAPPHLDS